MLVTIAQQRLILFLKVAGIAAGETGAGQPRLHFGFTCELEELVRNKLGTDSNT
jgi:hypothetical protein